MLLTSTWWLADHGGAPTQRALADHAGTDPMMTSQVVRRLEAGGLLERSRDTADARVWRVAPTAAGRAVLAGALADVEAVDVATFATVRERPGFLDALAELAEGPGADA